MATVSVRNHSKRTAHLLELMKKGDDAFNSRDWDAVKAVYHPKLVAYITGNANPIYGWVAYKSALERILSTFPDMHVQNDPYHVQFGIGDWITVVGHATGTFKGRLPLPNGKIIEPTGKNFEVEEGRTSKWDGDQLLAISAFWDSSLLARQIGVSS
jgi:hypothetical protein